MGYDSTSGRQVTEVSGKPATCVFREMKGADFSETMVTAYEITQCSSSEDYNPNMNFV
jgi:hypothetical protein